MPEGATDGLPPLLGAAVTGLPGKFAHICTAEISTKIHFLSRELLEDVRVLASGQKTQPAQAAEATQYHLGHPARWQRKHKSCNSQTPFNTLLKSI